MTLFSKKAEAIKLRREGKSINEICRLLTIAKSTTSVWCREVQLTNVQKEHLRKSQIASGYLGRMKGVNKNRQGKIDRIERERRNAKKMLGRLASKDRLMLGIGLYWGEGTKTDTSTTSFVNSDPHAIRFMVLWFREHFGISSNGFNPYISIVSTHRDREKVIKKYWARETGLPLSLFRKVIYLKVQHKRVYENHDSYYGTLALRIRKSTNLKYRIRGLLEIVANMST